MRRARPNEEGSALTLALVFVAVVGLMATAVLSFTDFGFRMTRNSRAERADLYAADAALEAAIHQAECTNYEHGQLPVVNADLLGDRKLTVSCDPGFATEVAGLPTNVPRRAILALSTEADEGIRQAIGSGKVVVQGDVLSASKVDNKSTTNPFFVHGEVAAVGQCDGLIEAAAGLRCAAGNNPGADPAEAGDPGAPTSPTASAYAALAKTPPPERSVPACPEGWLVTFEPGTYRDAVALSDLTRGACTGKVLWFKPGVHYFDLAPPPGSPATCNDDPGVCTWSIEDPTSIVVGGTPKGWDVAAPARPPILVPGACATSFDPAPNDGVQLLFGGESRLRPAAGKMELCAQHSPDNQQIAIYGLGADGTELPPPDIANTGPLEAGIPLSPSSNAFAIEPTSIDSPPRTADAALSAGGATSARLTLTGYQPIEIPPGSRIERAILRVAHADEGDVAGLKVTVDSATEGREVASGAAPCVSASALCVHSAMLEDSIDLKPLGFNEPADFVDLSVTYEAFLAPGDAAAAVERLDGAIIEVAYTSPIPLIPRDTVELRPDGPVGLVPFSDPSRAFAIEHPNPAPAAAEAVLKSDADVTTADGDRTTASLALAGYRAPAMPRGSTIDAIALRVAHRDEGAIDRLRAIVQSGDADPPFTIDSAPVGCEKTNRLCLNPVLQSGFHEDRIDLMAFGITTAADLEGMSVAFEASLAPGPDQNGKESLDGIVVEVTYTRPPLQGLEGCVVTTCPLLQASGETTTVAIHGTVYAPTTSVELDLDDIAAPVIDRGLIARNVTLDIQPRLGYDGPAIRLPANKPTRPILTLSADEDIRQGAQSGRVIVQGDVFSNAGVTNESTRAFAVEGAIAALGNCTGKIEATAGRRCANDEGGPAEAAEGADPGYPLNIAAPPADVLAVPGCPASPGEWLVTLEPGTYRDATALSRLTDGSCPGKVVWFKPGSYYFEFAPPPLATASCANDAALCTWTVKDSTTNIVGGTPRTAWNPAAARPSLTLPGTCRTSEEPAPNAGIQFTFGGESRLHVTEGKIELCPRPSADQQQIAIYGVKDPPPSGFTALSGCLVAAPYPTTGCPLLKIAGTKTQVVIHGTVYTPSAAVDVDVANLLSPIFGRGVISRTLLLSIQAACFQGPLAGVRGGGPKEPTDPFVFTACIDGVPTIRARVALTNEPNPEDRRATIKSWSVLR